MKLRREAENLIRYISNAAEKADEDLALGYFRKLYDLTFTRQKDAERADGYVPGNFVLELKGANYDWLAGLFQGLAYGRDLDFAKVVVCAQDFLGVWFVADIPPKILAAVEAAKGAPSAVGKRLAREFKARQNELLKSCAYRLESEFLPNKKSLFSDDAAHIKNSLDEFEKVLRSGNRQRQRITLKNFQSILKKMTAFFENDQPLLAVRAFYSIIFGWDESAKVEISEKKQDAASVRGEAVTGLRPDQRKAFKEFVENHYVSDDKNPSKDVFFAHFDQALDAVDPEFRIKHGIFFTDLDLSRFAMWFVKRELGDIGKNYMVIDPACGSGNLVTNWRSPLELRHKVVSEIEPELLFAVERRMKGDEWHNGKFTVVPKVSEAKGLNFLDKSAEEYLDILKDYLKEKGLKPDKPLAFLCNPPYRSDDDQAAGAISYPIHPAIKDLTSVDGSSERYSCFLAQMKLICERAESSGLPGNSLLLLFTKAAWLTDRPVFQKIRSEIFGSFHDVGSIIVNGKEFFDVKGSFPIAFTIWKHAGGKKLNESRPTEIVDLTWVKRKDLAKIRWDSPQSYPMECEHILSDERSIKVSFGAGREYLKNIVTQTMKDFKRDRRKDEKNADPCGGLPLNDRRQKNKKTYGHKDGSCIGFMDDLTPCRVRLTPQGVPWFRLNSQFMDSRKIRCFSGPPDNRGYRATNQEEARQLFLWFALGRTFACEGYPMWVDAMEMWGLDATREVQRITYAIGFAENECVETVFPANNPVKGSPEIFVTNPMSPMSRDSFWNREMSPLFDNGSSDAHELVKQVKAVYSKWKKYLGELGEQQVTYRRPYFIGRGRLTVNSGLVQIKDFAIEHQVAELLQPIAKMQEGLSTVRISFHRMLTEKSQLNYFGRRKSVARKSQPMETPKAARTSKFQTALEKRFAISAYIVNELRDDQYFGRTKFAKVFFFADHFSKMDLQTNYLREAAGPLDPRALYNPKIGIEPQAERLGYFRSRTKPANKGSIVRYEPQKNIQTGVAAFEKALPDAARKRVKFLIRLLRPLNTDQVEIVSTLFACWNDLLKDPNAKVSDGEIIKEFLTNWHEKKKRFKKVRLEKALAWMKKNKLVPDGSGPKTSPKASF